MPSQITLSCGLIVTLLTSIQMFSLNMSCQMTLCCSLIVTLVTSILDTFMCLDFVWCHKPDGPLNVLSHSLHWNFASPETTFVLYILLLIELFWVIGSDCACGSTFEPSSYVAWGAPSISIFKSATLFSLPSPWSFISIPVVNYLISRFLETVRNSLILSS